MSQQNHSQDEKPAPFSEPWHAQALATAMSLQQTGVITSVEWSDALGAAIKRAQAKGDPDLGDTYYDHVLSALETILEQKALICATELATRKAQWEEAYRNTPHGKPVHLAAAK